jgi:amino acid transporter
MDIGNPYFVIGAAAVNLIFAWLAGRRLPDSGNSTRQGFGVVFLIITIMVGLVCFVGIFYIPYELPYDNPKWPAHLEKPPGTPIQENYGIALGTIILLATAVLVAFVAASLPPPKKKRKVQKAATTPA